MKTDIKNIFQFPIVLKVDDVGRIMEISRVTAYNLVHSEGFPCKYVGRRLVIPRDAFFKWLNGFAPDSLDEKEDVTNKENEDIASNG